MLADIWSCDIWHSSKNVTTAGVNPIQYKNSFPNRRSIKCPANLLWLTKLYFLIIPDHKNCSESYCIITLYDLPRSTTKWWQWIIMKRVKEDSLRHEGQNNTLLSISLFRFKEGFTYYEYQGHCMNFILTLSLTIISQYNKMKTGILKLFSLSRIMGVCAKKKLLGLLYFHQWGLNIKIKLTENYFFM